MNGDRWLIDTNIVLYLLNGDTHLADLLTDKELTLSNISRMELLSFPDITKGELAKVEVFLEAWPVVEINSLIEEQAIAIRRRHRLKLPDSLMPQPCTWTYRSSPVTRRCSNCWMNWM